MTTDKLKQISEALGNKGPSPREQRRQERQKKKAEKLIADTKKYPHLPGPVVVSQRSTVVEKVVEKVIVDRLPLPPADDVLELKKENERLTILADRLEEELDRYISRFGRI